MAASARAAVRRCVRIRTTEIAPEGALIIAVAARGKQRLDALHELVRNFIHEPRRLHRLILAKDAPARGTGKHELRARARHTDVAETPFLIELILLLECARVREHAF